MSDIDRIVEFSPGPPFEGRYKIPRDDAEFSRRMLAEHLSQQFFHVVDAKTAATHTLTSTTKAWTEEEYGQMLIEAGFRSAFRVGDWPEADPAFVTFRAVR